MATFESGGEQNEVSKESFTPVIEKSTGKNAYTVLDFYMNEQRRKYPGHDFPGEEILHRLRDNTALETYEVLDDTFPIGIVAGLRNENFFEGVWFAVDPEYQHTNVAQELLRAVSEAYNEVHLLADAFGAEKYLDTLSEEADTRRGNRQKALVRYYKKFGFVPNTAADSYTISQQNPTFPIPMIWKKPNSEAE